MENTYDLIIVGGGPAGITAGIYAGRYKINTLLITESFGGQMAKKAVDIENYPGFDKISGLELVQKFKNQLMKNIDNIERDLVAEIKKLENDFLVTTSKNKQFKSRAVIIASGAVPRFLNIPGEKDFVGRGISYCVACDAPFFKDKTVAVIGGGNAGFEAAVALNAWAKKIYILEYGSRSRADQINQEEVGRLEKAKVLTEAAIREIRGNGFVESITYQDLKSQENKTLEVQGVFMEIGYEPATSFVKDLVDFNEKGEIKVDPRICTTKIPGLFAVGDVTDVAYKQIAIAAGDGVKAALAVYEYLKKH